MFNGSGSAYDDEEEALMTQTQAPSSHTQTEAQSQMTQTQAPSQTQIAGADEPVRPRASDVRSSSTDRIGSNAGGVFHGSGGAYDEEEEALMMQT